MTNRIPQIIYGILGAIFLIAGGGAILKPDILLPEVTGSISENLDYLYKLKDSVLHLTQELGVAIFGIGATLIWATFNVEKVGTLIYAFLIFTGLFGGIHWMEYFEGNRKILSPLINSLPFALLLIVMLLQRRKQVNINA